MNTLFVGLGGAAGAVLRYWISLIPVKTSYPILTLLTNAAGALLIGFIVGMAGREVLSKQHVLLLKTGLCGGFTTFSTFSLESVQLWEQGRPLAACSYVGFSLLFSILGVILGGCLASAVSRR